MARLIKEVGRNYNTVILPEQLTTVAWASVTGTPTTIAGYGITDAIAGSGTADYVPKFATGTTLSNSLMRVTSEAVGIGVAPKTWYSSDRVLQLGLTSSLSSSISIAEDLRISNNAYYNTSAVPKYIADGVALLYQQFASTHIFQSAASGLADGTITWVDQMQILDDGTTLIATNSSSGNYKLQVNGNTFTNGEIKTAAPTGGTAENWRLGSAAASSGDTQNTKIEVEIDGVLYYLMAFTV